MKTRTFLTLALAALLLAGLLAGCNVNVNTDSAGDPNASPAEEGGEPSPLPEGNEEQINNNPDGNIQGGEVEGPANEGIPSDAKYQKDIVIEPGKYEGKELVMWTWWDMGEEDQENIARFEAATGCKITYVNKQYEVYGADLVKAVGTGDGPDICYFGSEAIPAYVTKGFLIPVSDYLDMSKVSFETSQSVIDYFTFNGKLYVVPDTGPSTSKLYFRKDLFANASVDNPYDLWKAGNWTWDEFVRIGQEVRSDVDGDGEFDIWGYYSWQQEQLLYSNGANYVQWVDGNPTEGLSDPKAIRAMEWDRALNEQYGIVAPYDPDLDPTAMLIAGKIAMMYWGDWLLYGEDGLRTQLGDNLGIAPFPKGPDATAPFGDAAAATKEGIAACAKEPELAALFLLYKRLPANEEEEAENNTKAEADRIRDFGSLEVYEMCLEMANYAITNPCPGFTGLQNIVDAVRNAADMTPAQAIEAYKAAAQGYIDRTWIPE
ncbi:MAG: extracellular solute-binding protein [Oscillospiraceae bacterium]|jgi:multiple sugar transport system substrate-binding protein|nr:extracellular solute-binding protein [Oscillospiraceae bacterium]